MGINLNHIIEVESEEEKNAVIERLMTPKSPDEIKAIRENLDMAKALPTIVNSDFKIELSNFNKMADWLNSLDNKEFRRVMRHLEIISKQKGV